MKVEVKQKREVILILNEDEANWLKAYVQNPICEPQDELEKDSIMRCVIFKGIGQALSDD